MGVTGLRSEGVVLRRGGVDWPRAAGRPEPQITLPQSGCQGLGFARQRLLFLGPELRGPSAFLTASSPHLSPVRTLLCRDKGASPTCNCTLTYNTITSAKILFPNKVTRVLGVRSWLGLGHAAGER